MIPRLGQWPRVRWVAGALRIAEAPETSAHLRRGSPKKSAVDAHGRELVQARERGRETQVPCGRRFPPKWTVRMLPPRLSRRTGLPQRGAPSPRIRSADFVIRSARSRDFKTVTVGRKRQGILEMAQPAASSDRQVLGRRARGEWRLRLLKLVLGSLLIVPAAIGTIATRDPAMALGFFVLASIWFSVFIRAVGTGRMVTFDSSEVE